MCVTLTIPINTIYRINNVGEMYFGYNNELATKTIIYFHDNNTGNVL